MISLSGVQGPSNHREKQCRCVNARIGVKVAMLLSKLLVPLMEVPQLRTLRSTAAATNFATYLIWLWRLSQHVSPARNLHGRLGRLRFLTNGLRNRSALFPFIKAPENSALGRSVRSRPQLLGIMLHSRQTVAPDLPTRLDNLVQHFDEVVQLEWPDLVNPEMSLEIMSMAEIAPGMRLMMDQPPWFSGEGPLVLNLFDGEERLYSLAFALRRKDGLLTAQVGAIQGRALAGIMEMYRQLTRSSHGLRPRDLLIEMFRLFCNVIEIRRILLVSDSHRQHRDAYFGSAADAVVADYNAIWQERGAHRIDDATFELPLHSIRRVAADVPARKRALYRERYALLDTLTARMEQRISAMRRTSSLAASNCDFA